MLAYRPNIICILHLGGNDINPSIDVAKVFKIVMERVHTLRNYIEERTSGKIGLLQLSFIYTESHYYYYHHYYYYLSIRDSFPDIREITAQILFNH